MLLSEIRLDGKVENELKFISKVFRQKIRVYISLDVGVAG
jgi:hypothetical protein